MKKVYFAALLLLGLSVIFSSCEKSGTENGKDEESPIVGCWTYENWGDKVDEYFEFTNTGLINDYFIDDINYASFQDGVLSHPGEWVLDDVYKYWIEDGLLYWDECGVDIYEFEMIGKDKFRLLEIGDTIPEYFVRIKKFTK